MGIPVAGREDWGSPEQKAVRVGRREAGGQAVGLEEHGSLGGAGSGDAERTKIHRSRYMALAGADGLLEPEVVKRGLLMSRKVRVVGNSIVLQTRLVCKAP